MTSERPFIGTGVFIIKEEKFLLKKRQGSHGAGTWCLAGGYLEFGESFEACAKRESKEEFGVDIKNVTFAALTNDIYKEEGKHFATIFMKSEYAGGEPRNMEPEKCTEIGWFTWDDLPTPLFLPLENLKKTGFDPFH